MKKYIRKIGGIKTEFEFVLSKSCRLDSDLPVSTPMTFAFVGQNLILLEKNTGWWDVPGGKIEGSETWKEALIRESKEEAGVLIDHVTTIGYVKATNRGDKKFPRENILPVTISFVKEVYNIKLAKEIVQRQALKRSEAKEVLDKREDNGQLSEIFDYVIEYYDSQNYEYEFEYIPEDPDGLLKLPKTQAMTFVQNAGGNFIAVRDVDERFYSLPGGGCYMDETDEECAIREVKEEAQCDVKNLKLLGTVVVRVKKEGEVLSESRQLRYLGQVDTMEDFVPEKDGLEIVERKEVDLDFLQKNTKILNNDTGVKIIEDLKNKI